MRLSERELRIWAVPLDEPSPPLVELTADERVRAEGYRCPGARATFIQTRTALRRLLGRYLDLPPAAVVLERGDQGKPRLGAAMGALQFNVSHSGRLALIALSRAPVGIDLEWMQADLDWRELLPVCCHPAELAAFEGATDSEGRARLLRLWTAKEAYLKGRGEGLSLPLTAIRLNTHADGWQPGLEAPWDDGQGWRLQSLNLPSGYLGCIATPLSSPLIRLQFLPGPSVGGPAGSPTTPCFPLPLRENSPWNVSRACTRPAPPLPSNIFASKARAS